MLVAQGFAFSLVLVAQGFAVSVVLVELGFAFSLEILPQSTKSHYLRYLRKHNRLEGESQTNSTPNQLQLDNHNPDQIHTQMRN